MPTWPQCLLLFSAQVDLQHAGAEQRLQGGRLRGRRRRQDQPCPQVRTTLVSGSLL
jgi:hypothetical protein